MPRGEGESPISGYIVGKYTGLEPLEDYGRALGCTTIEYERGGVWVKIDTSGTSTKTA